MKTFWNATQALVAATVLLFGITSVAVADHPVTNSTAPPEETVAVEKTLQSYDLSWWSVDGGGGSSSGGSFVLIGAVGQPGVAASSTGSNTLTGGVWAVPETVDGLLLFGGFESGDTSEWDNVLP